MAIRIGRNLSACRSPWSAAEGATDCCVRQYQLLTRHEEEWSAPIRGVASKGTFRRGFIEDVEAKAQAFLDGAEGLFRQVPVRRVRLRWGWGGPHVLWTYYVPLLAERSGVERLRGLDLSGNVLGNESLQALLVSPRLGRLTELSLRECQIGDRGVRRWPSRRCSPGSHGWT